MQRIALVTCFRPGIGGGGTILRSLCDHLPSHFEITWFHLGSPVLKSPSPRITTVSLGNPLSGGKLWSDLLRTPLWWRGGMQRSFDRMARQILSHQADCHWIVAMNEGIPLGLRLAALAPLIPLHVSVHDDQEHGVYARSTRYRWFARLTRRPFGRLLQTARTVDVITHGMQTYYAQRFGIRSTIVRSVMNLPPEEFPAPSPSASSASRQFRIGHIGTIYRVQELSIFLQSLAMAGRQSNRSPFAHFVGLDHKFHSIVQNAGVEYALDPPQEESTAIRALATCDAVYAMYPFDNASRVFRSTSLPTKLTTYLKVGRPIVVHAPADSTLVDAVQHFGVGNACTTNTPEALAETILQTLAQAPEPSCYRHMAQSWYDPANSTKLAALLVGEGYPPES